MRSGEVVSLVQEKLSFNRQPAPIRRLQPLSQTLRVCQLPLHRGAKPRGGTKDGRRGACPPVKRCGASRAPHPLLPLCKGRC